MNLNHLKAQVSPCVSLSVYIGKDVARVRKVVQFSTKRRSASIWCSLLQIIAFARFIYCAFYLNGPWSRAGLTISVA